VPLILTEELGLPCITIARKIEVSNGAVQVERVIPDGYEVVEAPLPALVTVSNELGLPLSHHACHHGGESQTSSYVEALGPGSRPASLQSSLQVVDLFVPVQDQTCEFIDGSDEREIAHTLFQKLRESRLM
jgi:electron transfer flavoprotein beta subunit